MDQYEKITGRSSGGCSFFWIIEMQRRKYYDYTAYKKQYDSNAVKYHAKNRKQLGDIDEEEYLSRMKRTDKLVPVITVTVYYGDKPWDGASSLHGLLDIPQGLEKFVNHYKMLLIEARENGLNLHNMENEDLFNLFEIILGGDSSLKETREKAIKYCDEHDVSRNLIMTVAGATGNHIDYEAIGQEKGVRVMCTLFPRAMSQSPKDLDECCGIFDLNPLQKRAGQKAN